MEPPLLDESGGKSISFAELLLLSAPNMRAALVKARGRVVGFVLFMTKAGAGEISIGCGNSLSGVRVRVSLGGECKEVDANDNSRSEERKSSISSCERIECSVRFRDGAGGALRYCLEDGTKKAISVCESMCLFCFLWL